jgi:hypothetical protein
MANIPIRIDQGGKNMVVEDGATLKIEGTIVLPDEAIGTDDIVDEAVTFSKTAMWVSAEQTGTGMDQTIAHTIGIDPAAVMIVPTDLTPATVGSYAAAVVSHDDEEIVVNVTSGKKFIVWAMG